MASVKLTEARYLRQFFSNVHKKTSNIFREMG